MGQSPDRRADHLSGRRDRYGAAASVTGRRGERATRLRIGDSTRVCAGDGREFEHPRAHTVPCGGGTVARSMIRPPQPTPWSCTGRQRSRKPTSFTAASALSGDRHTAEASAEAVGSWIGRLSHHRMSSCELWDAQSPARRPHSTRTDSSRGSDAPSGRCRAVNRSCE